MEEKVFVLLEKLYGEFRDFKEETNQRFEMIDKRFEKMDERFEKIDERFEKMDERFDDLEAQVLQNRKVIEENARHIEQNGRGILRIESKLENVTNDKVRILFDAHTATHEKLEEMDGKLDRIKLDLNGITIKTASSDSLIIEMKQRLKDMCQSKI